MKPRAPVACLAAVIVVMSIAGCGRGDRGPAPEEEALPGGDREAAPEFESSDGGAKVGIRVVSLEGAALTWRGVEPASEEATRLLEPGETIASDASILTAADSVATVRFPQIATLNLAGDTMVHLSAQLHRAPRLVGVAQSAGLVNLEVEELFGSDRFTVKVGELAIWSARGSFSVHRSTHSGATISVSGGRARILPWAAESLVRLVLDRGSPEEVTAANRLAEELSFTLRPDEAILIPTAISAAEYEELERVARNAIGADGFSDELAAARILLQAVVDSLIASVVERR